MKNLFCLFILLFSLNSFAQILLLELNEKDAQKIMDTMPGLLQKRVHGKTNLFLKLTNDFAITGFLGITSHDDDFGHTHGTEFSISGYWNDEYFVSFTYSTDLYTMPENIELAIKAPKTEVVPQYFVNENIAKIIVDNINAKRAWYWKASVGWQELNHTDENSFFISSSQQRKFHELINSSSFVRTSKYNYIEDSRPDHRGVFTEFFFV